MSSESTDVRVKIGEHDYALYRQRIGYLENKVRGLFRSLQTGQASLEQLGHSAYDLLVIFIGVGFMPEHEFRGYPTREAFEAGDYVEEYDKSPDIAQVEEAIKAALKVNRFDLFGALGKFFSPEMLRAAGDNLLVEAIENAKTASGDSPGNGSTATMESAPQSSTTPASTPDDSASEATADPSGDRLATTV